MKMKMSIMPWVRNINLTIAKVINYLIAMVSELTVFCCWTMVSVSEIINITHLALKSLLITNPNSSLWRVVKRVQLRMTVNHRVLVKVKWLKKVIWVSFRRLFGWRKIKYVKVSNIQLYFNFTSYRTPTISQSQLDLYLSRFKPWQTLSISSSWCWFRIIHSFLCS